MHKQVPLNEVSDGRPVTVVEIRGGKAIHTRLQSLGIRVGVRMTKVSGLARFGPTIVRCGTTQTALGNGISRQIFVEDAE